MTGLLTAALPFHAQEVLQQSQYRVEWPAPEAARMPGALASRRAIVLACILYTGVFIQLIVVVVCSLVLLLLCFDEYSA